MQLQINRTNDKGERVKYGDGSHQWLIDDSLSMQDLRRRVPSFFTPHGEREYVATYRGFVIVRHTVRFSNGTRERHTVVYAFDQSWNKGNGELFHILTAPAGGTRNAKRLIDRFWQGGAIKDGDKAGGYDCTIKS